MGSAAETSGGSEEPRKLDESVASLAGTRANPLAIEISVNATGTRPGSGQDKRELFSEDTETVLVFPDGAVIQLSAAVATGQLLFLTNKKRNIEVVCQVIGKRIYRPTSCYVELKFTEDMPDFWGVTFPESGAEVQAAVAEVQSIASAELTEDGAESHAPMPTDQEVESLREDVEVLRQQLEQAQRARDSAQAVADMAAPGGWAPVEPTPETETLKAGLNSSMPPLAVELPVVEDRTVIMSANEPAPTFAPTFTPATVIIPSITPTVPSTVASEATEQVPPAPWKSFGLAEDVAVANRASHMDAPPAVPPASERKPTTPMALPNRELGTKVDPEQELIDQLLPQPALDFSKAPKHVGGPDPDDPYSIYKPTKAKMEKWILVTLILALAGSVGFGVWKLGLIHTLARLRMPKNATVSQPGAAPAPVATPPASGPGARPEEAPLPGKKLAEDDGTTSPSIGTGSPADAAVSGERKTAKAADFHAAGPVPESENQTAQKSGTTENGSAPLKRAHAPSKNVKKKSTQDEVVEAPVEAPVPDDAPVVAAKLLKAVSPIYPPEAMNNFITGDVRLKAEVDDKGKIQDVEVVSGPAALRPAAIEAMKQYEYAPATKGGRPVASQINATIKFWFSP